MTILRFNDDWAVRSPLPAFADTAVAASVPVRLPHDALRDTERAADAPGGAASAYYPNAAFTYVKRFHVPVDWAGKLVRLEVQGAYRRAQVFINEEFAGNRADGYARFFVDLTPYLLHGEENVLRIDVRSGEDSRWYSGAGLHRPVLLHVDEPLHIAPDGVHVSTLRLEDDQAVLEVATTLVNAGLVTQTVRLRTVVTGPDGAEVEHDDTPSSLAPGERAVVRQRLYVQEPKLWSPDSPAMHTAHVQVEGQQPEAAAVVAFGIRTVSVDPRKGLQINGTQVLLRGACVHHDNGPLGAAAIDRAEERRVELLKGAGFNAIRMSHNPASSAMLDACDRLGVLVMDEAFDMWTRFKTTNDYAGEFPQWWSADLESMVIKDRNHPSVIMYSIGNEIAEVGTVHGARWARALAEHVRALDPSRPVTNGVNPLLAGLDNLSQAAGAVGGLNEMMASMDETVKQGVVSTLVTNRTEESSAALDVLGLNYAEARYALDQSLFPHRVIVGSETFPTQIGELWPLVLSTANVIGDFTWTGWDYLGEAGIGATAYEEDEAARPEIAREYPWLTAWCGDFDITGHRRPVSYYREIVYGLRKEPYIAVLRPEHHDHHITMQSPWAWSDSVSSWSWRGFEDRPVSVEIYADADEVELLLDGALVGRTSIGERLPMLAEIETVYRPGVLTAVAYRNGVKLTSYSLATSRSAPRLDVSVDRPRLTNTDGDLAYVSIELRDADGVLVNADDRAVTVTVDGAVELAGMCSSAPTTIERFDANTWRTHDGRALAIVRPTTTGPASVTVSAEGVEPVKIVLEVSPML